jgi:hypothetical protein
MDMVTPIMAPRIVGRVADEPPTTLEAMLQAFVEEEQLTGTNQWRSVFNALSGVRASWMCV